MDLSTEYMGLKLRSPLVCSASPLAEDLDNLKRMEDAGAAAVVLHSLFEEQLRLETREIVHHMMYGTESYAEALTYFPPSEDFLLGPEEYLAHIGKAKEALRVPVIASLNGTSPGGWTDFARSMEQAGADAIELNVYSIPTDPDKPGAEIERETVDILASIKSAVKVPVAIKLSPFFSNMAHMARQLDRAGADGMVLFNRFYQPDIDLEALEVKSNVLLSTPQALRMPLTWIGILHGKVRASLAATGGVHDAADALKVIMAGADAAMLCSVLMKRGIGHIAEVESELTRWMEKREYSSIRQMKGSLSHQKCSDPSAFVRANYMRSIMTIPPSVREIQ